MTARERRSSTRRLASRRGGYANLARQVPFAEPRRAAARERPSRWSWSTASRCRPGEFGGDAIVRLFTNRLDPAAHPYYRVDRRTCACPRTS